MPPSLATASYTSSEPRRSPRRVQNVFPFLDALSVAEAVVAAGEPYQWGALAPDKRFDSALTSITRTIMAAHVEGVADQATMDDAFEDVRRLFGISLSATEHHYYYRSVDAAFAVVSYVMNNVR